MSDFIQQIWTALSSKQSVLFCGAGISWHSGLPVATELTDEIFANLRIPRELVDHINNTQIPFEAFMHLLKSVSDIDPLLKLFLKGKPSGFHHLAADLAARDWLKIIITTNFDCLFEDALNKIPYTVICQEEDFDTIEWYPKPENPVQIVKIHGCARIPESIRITLDQVALKKLSIKRRAVIRNLFNKGSHRNVLFFGYSCSDVFDISPQIALVEKVQKEVLFIDHQSVANNGAGYIELLASKTDKNPFTHFTSGQRFYIDTDVVIDSCFRIMNSDKRCSKYSVKGLSHWKTCVEQWANNYTSEQSVFLCEVLTVLIYERACMYQDAAAKLIHVIDACDHLENQSIQTVCEQALGMVALQLGMPDLALRCLQKALAAQQNTKTQATLLTSIGFAFITLGKLYKALDYFHQSLEQCKSDQFLPVLHGQAYNGMSKAYRMLGEYKKACQCIEQAKDLYEHSGDQYGVCSCLGEMGNIYFDQGQNRIAHRYYITGHRLATQLGDLSMECNLKGSIGNVLTSDKRYKEAIDKWYLPALDISLRIENNHEAVAWLGNTGRCYMFLGELENAKEYLKRALELARKCNEYLHEAKWHANIGIVYRKLNKKELSLKHGSNAVRLLEKIIGPNHKDTDWARKELQISKGETVPTFRDEVRKQFPDEESYLRGAAESAMKMGLVGMCRSICDNSKESVLRDMYRLHIGDDSCVDEASVRDELRKILPTVWKNAVREVANDYGWNIDEDDFDQGT